jgi:tetratricopeptide (TPR) repeat protein
MYYDLALDYDRLGEFSSAQKAYTRAVQLEPNFTAAYYNKALDLDNLEKYDESVEVYSKVLELQPTSIDTLLRKGNALNEIGEYEEAIASYEQILQIDPTHAVAKFQLDVNRDILESANRTSSSYAVPSTLFGVMSDDVFSSDIFIWYSSNPFEDSYFTSLNDAEILGNIVTYDDVWVSRGSTLERMSMTDQAVESYTTALLLNPSSAEAWVNLASSYDKLGDYSNAITCYEQAVLLNPSDKDAWYSKGLSHYNNGDNQLAVESFSKVLLQDSGNIDALIMRQWLMII